MVRGSEHRRRKRFEIEFSALRPSREKVGPRWPKDAPSTGPAFSRSREESNLLPPRTSRVPTASLLRLTQQTQSVARNRALVRRPIRIPCATRIRTRDHPQVGPLYPLSYRAPLRSLPAWFPKGSPRCRGCLSSSPPAGLPASSTPGDWGKDLANITAVHCWSPLSCAAGNRTRIHVPLACSAVELPRATVGTGTASQSVVTSLRSAILVIPQARGRLSFGRLSLACA